MKTEADKNEETKVKQISFKCKFCEKDKLLDEMIVITRYSPAVVLCRDCQKKIR